MEEQQFSLHEAMDSLDQKIFQSEEVIARVLSVYKSPVVMSSFGKDSMVMLDILKRVGIKLPILFHREPFFPAKLRFANEIIEREEYTVYDYPPSKTSLIKNHGKTELVSWYSVGTKFAYLPTGLVQPESGRPFLCGYRDLYLKPLCARFIFPWDMAFIGHKSHDHDPIFGDIPLKVDVKANHEAPDYAFPLRHFTDADIWEYHERFGVPVNILRYDPDNGHKERADLTFNNDYYPACIRCIDRDESTSVLCPLLGKEISNISSEVLYTEPERPAYLGENSKAIGSLFGAGGVHV